jgi:hypothetical protein
MKTHLAAAQESDLTALMRLRAEHSVHTLTDDPQSADLILFLGNPTRQPNLLLNHPLYREFPAKSAIFSEDDEYLPLLPGVYCSPRSDQHTRAGRVVAWSYVSANSRFSNPFIATESPTQKSLLFSFQGGSTSLLRKRMYRLKFNRAAVLIEDSSAYEHWNPDGTEREQRQRAYAATIAASHFVLCPRGAGSGSFRLFEVMKAGVAPVLISDAYVLPPDVPWETFLLRIPEKEIRRLPQLLEPHLRTSAERGRLARQAWLDYFAPEREFDSIVTLAAATLHHGPPAESTFRQQQRSIIFRAALRRSLRRKARAIILRMLKLLGLKSPYRLNR